MQRLLASHPDYLDRVQAFIAADPLVARRQAVVAEVERRGVRLG